MAVARGACLVAKVAIAVLYTALRGKKLGVEAIYSTAEQVGGGIGVAYHLEAESHVLSVTSSLVS